MKTEDLKNYIFEQLNETSRALKQKLMDGRFKQSMRAYNTGSDIYQENEKILKKTGSFDPSLTAVREIILKKAEKASDSYRKAQYRSHGLKGDGSPRTPTQESALNFINGLKRLQENSRRRKDAIPGKRTTRIQNYSDKMYPMPDDANEFNTGQIESQRAEADRALGRRENPHDIKKNLRHVRIF